MLKTYNALLERNAVNALRFLAVDTVEKAGSGHPGTPMGAAAMAYALWDRVLKHNPENPHWPDRDRFVLSPGHASALLYALLHLYGYDLPLEELKRFRQWDSKTPGHPERGHTPGVEVTTGPLAQGFAHAVGMAMAERHLAAHHNRDGHEVVDHHTYALVSDGDLQEGLAAEAASLAGTLRLGKLVCLYDDNDVQLSGATEEGFGGKNARLFAGYGWQVVGPVDGLDPDAVEAAIHEARSDAGRPSLVVCKTIIGYGSPQQATNKVHGEPLGEEGVRAARRSLGWPEEPAFHVPDDVLAHTRKAVERGREAEAAWEEKMRAYEEGHPEDAARFRTQVSGELPGDWDAGLKGLFDGDEKPVATRVAGGKALGALVQRVHAVAGGSADLDPSTKTTVTGYGDFGWGDYCGHNVHFGVREHAMGSIAGGMAAHGGVVPYTATFFTFSDYMRPPMRLAALMGLRVVYVFTHDSIGLGEDGPTHQPVEHLMALRAVPNLTVVRPADATETAEAWRAALLNACGPTALVLTRQKLPVLDRNAYAPAEALQKGGYTLWENAGEPEVLLIGTGSETHLALEAGHKLAEEGISARVVSMPSWELFDAQPAEYRDSVLPPDVRSRVAVEAATTLGWERYVGLDGAVVGMTGFGASAPAPELYERFGITTEKVVAAARELWRA